MRIIKDWNIIKKRLADEQNKIEDEIKFPSKLIDFLILAEDHRYYRHIGFDIISIIRAIFKNTFFHKHEGASTIEQQLVRVIINDYRPTFFRKLKEILLAILLNKIADKKDIALIYLNIAYYGTDYQDLNSIMNKYGLKKSDSIQDDICSEIIARLKYPEPHKTSIKRITQIQNRKQYILRLYYKKERYECKRLFNDF